MKLIISQIRRLLLKLAGIEIHSEQVKTAITKASKKLIDASMSTPETLMQRMDTSMEGLSNTEAKLRLDSHGLNEVAHEKSMPWYRQLLKSFFDPFIGVLVVLGIASFFTEVVFAPSHEQSLILVIIITILILISALLAFIQEYKANRASEQLLLLIQSLSRVSRTESGVSNLPTKEIVPGDIIHLAAGDIMPADVWLFDINNLSVNEAALTGESLPVDKFEHQDAPSALPDRERDLTGINPLDLDNIGYQGTNVVSGSAKGITISTGSRTYLGAMSEELVGHHPSTSFDEGVKNVSLLLIRFMLVMVPIIFLINGLTKGDWLQALMFGLAVAVGLTPEMLPTIVTVNLAKGSIEMAQQKTVVKRLNAIQNLGAMDVLCTDKTGTLTEDTVALEVFHNLEGENDKFVLDLTFLNSYFQQGFQNPIDDAVVAHPDSMGSEIAKQRFERIEEIPFETARRRMSVIVRENKEQLCLICKGAIDEMLSVSTSFQIGDQVLSLTDEIIADLKKTANQMNSNGLRVLLVAYKFIDSELTNFSKTDESELILAGFVGFLDPPKVSAGEAIQAIHDKNVKVIVITGDNEISTRRVCHEIGFTITGLMDGIETDGLSDEALMERVEEVNVFVRTAPLQKSRILNMIKQNNHTVGFLGDGINDAHALRDADVGISVDNAVDIAKESADILLLEKSLMVLEEGIGLGRQVFGNIMKYIKMTVSSNFGNVFSVLVASIVLPFPPMLPLHLLIQNLLYDISQISIPWDHMDEEYLVRPKTWNPKSIARFTVFIGPVSSIFDFTTFALLWYVIGANTIGNQSLFHSGWFVLGLLSQTLIIHLIRTRKIPFFEATASRPVIIMTSLIMVIGLGIPFTGFGVGIGFQPLPMIYFPWLLVTLIAYCVFIQFVKTWYIRKFDTWL